MSSVQVYRVPFGIGVVVSLRDKIKARIAMQVAPLHPVGSKANNPPLPIAGFTVQAGPFRLTHGSLPDTGGGSIGQSTSVAQDCPTVMAQLPNGKAAMG